MDRSGLVKYVSDPHRKNSDRFFRVADFIQHVERNIISKRKKLTAGFSRPDVEKSTYALEKTKAAPPMAAPTTRVAVFVKKSQAVSNDTAIEAAKVAANTFPTANVRIHRTKNHNGCV
jgi:hypothetical protein